jgi:hypothetical protein
MRQSRPRATSWRGLQVQGSFNEPIGPLFKNRSGFSHSKFRPRARSRCHWACSEGALRARTLEFAYVLNAKQPIIENFGLYFFIGVGSLKNQTPLSH